MPRLDDDLRTVTLDLHGATVAEAERLLRATLRVATVRGRTQLRVIHGASTSDPEGHHRTIRNRLHELLRRGLLPGVTSSVAMEGMTLLGLPLGRPTDRRRILLQDVL